MFLVILVWAFILAFLDGPYVSSIPCGDIAKITPVPPTVVSGPGLGIYFSISFWTLGF